MESSFICGDTASRYILDISEDWNNFQADVLVLYAPGELDVGRFLGHEIEEVWIKSLKERRAYTDQLRGAPISKAQRWMTIPNDIVCDQCNKDVLPEKLKIICLDTSLLHQPNVLESLRHLFQTQVFVISLALTNKMLMYPELLQRIYYLKEAVRHVWSLTSEKKFKVLLTEPLKNDNFLFGDEKPVKFFSRVHIGGTIYGRAQVGYMLMFKKSLSIIFSGKYAPKKFSHNCSLNRLD